MSDSSSSPVDTSADSETNSEEGERHEMSSKHERTRGRSHLHYSDKKRSRRSSSSPRKNTKKKKKSHTHRHRGHRLKKVDKSEKETPKNSKHDTDKFADARPGTSNSNRETNCTITGVNEGKAYFTYSSKVFIYFFVKYVPYKL